MNAQNLMDAANNLETDEGQLRFFLSNAATELQKYKDALEKISSYDDGSKFGKGICYYGCDAPYIAQVALGYVNAISIFDPDKCQCKDKNGNPLNKCSECPR